jgi:uncharacterized protein (DUF305 family)
MSSLSRIAALVGGLILLAAPVALAARGGPASDAFMKASERMSQAMNQPMSGDPDADFAAMMKAHHQGAIDMARVELQYGADPQLKAMAQDVINAQTKEIDTLDQWLKQRK